MNDVIFREYDIRGIVGTDLTGDIVVKIGKAYGSLVKRSGGNSVAVSGDCRLSTEDLRKSLISGILSTGCDVVDIGITTTPMLYFAVYTMDVDGGVMITGSHNPPDYNGFKMCIGKETIYGGQIKKIKEVIEKSDYVSGEGSLMACEIFEEYKKYMLDNIDAGLIAGLKCFKVGIDAGNGTAGKFVLPILEELGLELFPIFCEMDGSFPNHHPDPTVEENLKSLRGLVVGNNLDLGVAYDGDADRIGVVDDKGNIIWGDRLLMIFARDMLKEHKGAVIMSEVKSSQLLYDDIRKHGGNPVMWKTGHSLIKSKMKEIGALLAGEMSGHIFFADRFFGYDDAIYATLRLIEIIARSKCRVSELLGDLPQYYATPEIRIDCAESKKFLVVDEVKAILNEKKGDLNFELVDIDGLRIIFSDGWGLIRASNTQASLTLRFEAESEGRLYEIKSELEEILSAAMKKVCMD